MTESKIEPKNPQPGWLGQFLDTSLMDAPPYAIDINQVATKLDQNESPYDWPMTLKEKVMKHMLAKSWNRYPTAHAPKLAKIIADYVHVPAECVLTGPGSDHLLTLILLLFSAKARGEVIVARPSFPHYESQPKYYGIPVTPWHLTSALEYDVAALAKMPAGSVVFFPPPNNPVGNSLPYQSFEKLLQQHPQSLFIADEAYVEFSAQPYTPLLDKYANLILVRTFSKTMAAAGIRLGYTLASADLTAQLRKARLPYIVNEFTMSAVEILLNDAEAQANFKKTAKDTIAQRELLRSRLQEFAQRYGFKVYPSQANFLLLRWNDPAVCQKTYVHLVKQGFQLRNVSKTPGLEGCLRLTVGNETENQAFLKAFANS